MKERIVGGVVICYTVVAGVVSAQTTHSDCSQLTALKLPDIRIAEAVAVPAATTGPIAPRIAG